MGGYMLNPETTFIYALIDPRTDKIRYVGKSNNPQKRLCSHLSKTIDTPKGRWITELKELSLQPIMEILEEVAADDWSDKEKQWIRKLTTEGCNLTNRNPGGQGPYCHREEIKKQISRTMKGRRLSKEHKRNLSLAMKGRKPTAKVRRAQRKAATGRKKTKRELRLLSAANKGKVISEETKIKISRANSGRKHGLEYRINCGKRSAGFDEEQIHEIRNALEEGVMNITLAERYGVHPNTIYEIKSGRSYWWVE